MKYKFYDKFFRGHECPEKLTVQENHILINYNNTKESKISLPVKIDPSTVNTIQQHKNEGILFVLAYLNLKSSSSVLVI